VWDLSTSPYVDISGAKLVGDIQRELASRGVRFRVAEAHSWVRALLRKEIGTSIGEVSRRNSVDDVVTEELKLRSDASG
jgi:hypothetical protein